MGHGSARERSRVRASRASRASKALRALWKDANAFGRRVGCRGALFQRKRVEKPLPTRSSRSRRASRPERTRDVPGVVRARGVSSPLRSGRATRVRDVAACARPRRTVTRGGKPRVPFRASGVQLGTTDDISTMVTAVLCSSDEEKESAGRTGRPPGCRRERSAGAALLARAPAPAGVSERRASRHR